MSNSARLFNELRIKHELEDVIPEAVPYEDIFVCLLPLLDNILTRLESLEKATK